MFTFALVAIVALSSIVIYSSERNEIDATDDQTVTYYLLIQNDQTRDLDIIINENYFEAIDPSHDVKWEYLTKIEGGQTKYVEYAISDTLNSNTISMTNYSFELIDRGEAGEYLLRIKDTHTGTTGITDQLRLRCSISLTVHESTNVELKYDTKELYIVVNLSLGDGSVLPNVNQYNVSTYDGDNDGHANDPAPIDYIIVEEGRPVVLTPVYGNTEADPSEYYWYAVDLPKGLAMTSTGTIVGVPVNHTQYAIQSTVYVEDGYGKGTSYNLSIYVKPHDERSNVIYYLYNGVFDSISDRSDLTLSPTEYITQRDESVSLLVIPALGQITNPITKIQVVDKSVSEDTITVERKDITGNTEVTNGSQKYYVYQIPTSGTGMYTVKMYNDNLLVGSFDLYVMSKLLAVESAIIVGSDSSS